MSRLQNEIADAINQLSPEQMNIRRSGKWSIAEILEHLYLTYTGTTKGFGRLLSQPRPLAKATWKQRGGAFIVITLGYMPKGRKSPPVALPRGILAEKISTEILPAIANMEEIMSRAANALGDQTPVLDHPVLGPLSIRQWRKFHLVHGLHHVGQIRALRKSIAN